MWESAASPIQVVADQAIVAYSEAHIGVIGDTCAFEANMVHSVLQTEREQQRCAEALSSLAPSFRLRCTVVNNVDGLFVTTTWHHLMLGGWSVGVLLSEEADLLKHFDRHWNVRHRGFFAPRTAEESKRLLARPGVIGSFYAWLAERDVAEAQREWDDVLTGYSPVEYPWDAAMTSDAGQTSSASCVLLSPEWSQKMHEVSHESGTTFARTVQLLFGRLLMTTSGSSDIVFGNTVSGRTSAAGFVDGIESMVGMFVNTVPIRVFMASRLVLCTGTIDFVRAMTSVPTTGGHPVPMFAFQNFEEAPDDDLVTYVDAPTASTNVPLGVRWYDEASLSAIFSGPRHAVQLMKGNLLRAVANVIHISCALEGPVKSTDAQFATTSPPVQGGSQSAVNCWFTGDRSDKMGAAEEGEFISVGQVGERSSDYQAFSENSSGSTVTSIVMDRGLEMFCAIIGVMRSASTLYVADYENPPDRLVQLLELAGSTCCIVDGYTYSKLSSMFRGSLGVYTPTLQRPPIRVSSGYRTQMLAFTSGSTGVPKGVVLRQSDWCARSLDNMRRFNPRTSDWLISVCLPTFDAMHGEICHGLVTSSQFLFFSQKFKSDADYRRWLTNRFCLRFLPVVVPSFALHWLSEPTPTVEYLSIGGEAPTTALLDLIYRNAAPSATCWNSYGPAETTSLVTMNPIAPGAIPDLGTAMAGSRVSVLSATRQWLAPPSVLGELVISGIGLADAYLRNPSKTATSFAPLPGSGSNTAE
jgi:non-ribosomal peptide synthetase component F